MREAIDLICQRTPYRNLTRLLEASYIHKKNAPIRLYEQISQENLNKNHPEPDESRSKRNKQLNGSLFASLEAIKVNWQKNSPIAAISQQWSALVGKKLASNCTPLSLKRGILVVGASHPQWRQALIFTKIELIQSLNQAGFKIKDLRIQQYYPKEIKKIEPEKKVWANHPSRIDIHGLETCKICMKPAPLGEIQRWGKCGFCKRKDLI